MTKQMSKDEGNKPDLPFLSDRYVVEGVLGQGGMGVVYVARQKGLDRKVAIKVIHPDLDPRPALIARFEKEAKVYKELTHPNTVRIYDVDKTPNGHLFIVMEFLVGTPLDVLLHKERKFPPERVAVFAKQILKSLIEAHAHGIIHRDLKPANFMLCEQLGEPDLVKVLDFGVASFHEAGEGRITKTGDTVGTPHYMSPEQVTGETLDQRSDLYSLSVSLYELATGKLPYEGSSPFQVAVRHASPDPIELPEWFAETAVGQVTKRALNKDRELRYSSSKEMLGHLDHLLLQEWSVQSGPTADIVTHPPDDDSPTDKNIKRRQRPSKTVVEDPLGTDETVAEVTFNIRRQQRRTRFLAVAFAVTLLAAAGFLIIEDLESSDDVDDTTVAVREEGSGTDPQQTSPQTNITPPSPWGSALGQATIIVERPNDPSIVFLAPLSIVNPFETFVDGEPIVTPNGLNPTFTPSQREATVRIDSAGYPSWTGEIVLSLDHIISVMPTVPTEDMAPGDSNEWSIQFGINTDPTDAEIHLDGGYFCDAPCQDVIETQDVDLVHLRAEAEGYLPFHLAFDARWNIQITLELEPIVTPETVSQPEPSDEDALVPEEHVEVESESQHELNVADSDGDDRQADEEEQTDEAHDDGLPALVDDSIQDHDDAHTGLDQTVPPQDTSHDTDQQEQTDHGDTETTTAPILH